MSNPLFNFSTVKLTLREFHIYNITLKILELIFQNCVNLKSLDIDIGHNYIGNLQNYDFKETQVTLEKLIIRTNLFIT